ncbi:hypothetical protein HDU76_006534, partial [Blyttiomyces sp. JEL0837]
MPREKNQVPITTSQIYGWDSKPLFQTKDSRFFHPRRECEITKSYGQGFGRENGGEKGAAEKAK